MDLVKVEEMEKELIERGIIAPPEFGEDELRVKIMEIIVTEGKDSNLGRQIWQYCKIVDFDYESIKPILDKEPSFFSQLEELGSMQFNFMLLQVKELKKINEFIQLIKPFYTTKMVIEPGIINPDDWEKRFSDPGYRPYPVPSDEGKINLVHLGATYPETIKEEVNYDNLMPKDE